MMSHEPSFTKTYHCIAIGVAIAVFATAVRYIIPLDYEVMTTAFIFPAILFAAIIAGRVGALTTMVVGVPLMVYAIIPRSSPETVFDVTRIIGNFLIGLTILAANEWALYSRMHTERENAKRKQEDFKMFAKELAHRVKNILSVVQSVAYQTLKTDEVLFEKFAGRLAALATAQSLVVLHTRVQDIDIKQLIEQTIVPFIPSRFKLHGKSFNVLQQNGTWLALVLYELCTNSAKYGALSSPSGHVTIKWRKVNHNSFEVEWKEHGGPAIEQPPQGNGFGTKLLRGNEMHWEKDGLRCVIKNKI